MNPQTADELQIARRRQAAREELIRTREALELHYAEILARESIKHPLILGRYATCTRDEQTPDEPYRPFPADWTFMDYVMSVLQNEPVVFIKKSRTVMASWLVALWAFHEMVTKPATGVVIQSRDEDRAVNVVDYIKVLYENSIPQLKDRWPLTGPLHKQAYNRMELANDSWCVGIPGDPKKINANHPSIVVLDEGALIPSPDNFASALATKARSIVVLSSSEIGWFEEYVEGAIACDWPQYSIDAVDAYNRTKKTLFPVENDRIMTPNRAFNHDPLTWSKHHSRVSLATIEQPVPASQMLAKKKEEPLPEIGKRVSTQSFRESRIAWKPAANTKSPTQGLQFLRTKAGVAVVHLHYSARPDLRDERVVEKLRWRYPTLAHWAKEMELQARALSGALVYPEFDPAIHVVPDATIPKVGCRYCAIDVHPRTPTAVLWCLVDRWSDIYITRELWPSKCYGSEKRLADSDEENVYTVREYVETIAYLEGNEIEWFNAETDREYGVYRRKTGGEKIITRYMDSAGKAFNTRGEGEKAESWWEKYERFGLYLQDPYKRLVAGEDAIHDLLKLRQHNSRGLWPRLHIAASCEELILEMKRHKFRSSSSRALEERELKQKPAETRCHLIDCLRYLVASGDISYIRSLES